MPPSLQTWNRPGGQGWLIPWEGRLARALVAGLMLDVVLEAPARLTDPDCRRRHIKARLTQSLVRQLSGYITLDCFRLLMRHLEYWFQFYYPLMPPQPLTEERPRLRAKFSGPATADRRQSLVRRNIVKDWLRQAASEILPSRPQRKIHPDGVEDFLHQTQVYWFQVKDFAQYFKIDRKTAWEYLQKFHETRLLVHNNGRSAAARYRLADNFLAVPVSALEQHLAQAGFPASLASQVAQELAATAGEPFWEEGWSVERNPDRRAELVSALTTAAILEVVYQVDRQRLLRLRHRWLNH